MAAVIAVLTLLLVAGLKILGDDRAQARRAASERLLAVVEQARTTAITSRATVFLAIAEPGDGMGDDGSCRLGLFRVTDWNPAEGAVDGVLLRRWEVLPVGIVLCGGQAGALRNVLDQAEVSVRYGRGEDVQVAQLHGIAIGPRGGLIWPEGSDPVAFRIAEGSYQSGSATILVRGDNDEVAEEWLKIGRVVARPYRSN